MCPWRVVILIVHFSSCVVFVRSYVCTRESYLPASRPRTYIHNYSSARFLTPSGGSIDPSCVYHCNAKADAAAWAAIGCVVSGVVTGTKRSDLGDATPSPGWESCSITCPVDGHDQKPWEVPKQKHSNQLFAKTRVVFWRKDEKN